MNLCTCSDIILPGVPSGADGRLESAQRAVYWTGPKLATTAKRFSQSLLLTEGNSNDSTSIRFRGQYRKQPELIRGRRPARLAFGISIDHRPDLKQLLFILTTPADGGVSVQFRIADGNTNDSVTYIETWNTLRTVVSRADFLYVADSKLCSHGNLDEINCAGVRFVTVLPRSRVEDRRFRKWIQSNTPSWQLLWDQPCPKVHDGPPDRWYVYRDSIGSMEAWPLVWVWSTRLTERQRIRSQEHIAVATKKLTALRARIISTKARLRAASRIDFKLEKILEDYRVRRYLKVSRTMSAEHAFKQTRRGRPGPNSAYRRITRRHYDLEWAVDQAAISYDERSDGMYPSCRARHEGYYPACAIMPRLNRHLVRRAEAPGSRV